MMSNNDVRERVGIPADIHPIKRVIAVVVSIVGLVTKALLHAVSAALISSPPRAV
jgi:hypothetical protein